MQAEPATRSLGQTILRNSIFVSSGGGLIRLLGFAFTIYCVRTLGESAYGQYVTALAFTALLGTFFELGTTQYVERTLAQDRTRLPELLGRLISVRLLLALASVVLIPALAVALGYERIIVWCILLQTTTFVLAAVLSPLSVVLTSRERYDLSTAVLIVGQLGSILLGTLVLWLGGGLLWLVTTGLVVMPLQIGAALYLIRSSGIGPLAFKATLSGVQPLVRASLPFALTSLALTISFNVDTFLLSMLQPSNVVGWYGAAYRLVPTIVSLLGGFLTVITPSLARAYMNDREAVRRWTRTTIKWLAMFGLPAAAGVSLLAPSMIALLYGDSFAPSATVLAIIAWDIPLRLFNAFAGNVTAAVGLEKQAWRIFMTGSLLGVLLYVPAIMGFGIIGAAVVTVATDGINSVLFFRLLGKHLQASQIGVLLRASAAMVVMGAAVWLAAQAAGIYVAVGVGFVTYLVLALLMGLVTRETLHRIAGILQPRRHAS